MKAPDVSMVLLAGLRAKSQYETDRHYLGMSGAGLCPCAWYWRTVDPEPASDRQAWTSMVGYALEEKIVERLGAEQVEREIVADFDSRYRGHVDCQMPDGTLIEIKSVTWEKFVQVQLDGCGMQMHMDQCTAYMAHGGFPHAILVYIPRDIPWNVWNNSTINSVRSIKLMLPFYCTDVAFSEHQAAVLDDKARRVLAAMNERKPPRCTCGRCRR